MSDEHVLDSRRRALEASFFARKDQELLAELRERVAREKCEGRLCEQLGLKDSAVAKHLIEAGISADTLAALGLVPLVSVAWADGKLADAEREAVLRAAEQEGITSGTPASELLTSWLEEAPPGELLEAWSEYVTALRSTLDAAKHRQLGEELLARARQVAEAAGGFLGIHAISSAEEGVLSQLKQPFA